MEGYLKVYVKRTFTLSTYDKMWVTLDNQSLCFYEKLDLKAQRAMNVKNVVPVKNTVVSKLKPSEQGTKSGIKICNEQGQQLAVMDCEDPQVCNTWFNCLMKAVKCHVEVEERLSLPGKCCQKLNIDLSTTKLSKGVISRSYKRLALQAHPDKGGDVEVFNSINQAYTALMAYQTEEDDRNNSNIVDFEAVVEKGDNGVGLGIVVLEDKVRGQVIVQSVQDNIIIRGITAEAEGEIRAGDALVGIDSDDCSHWPLSRVRARLNTYRVPVGSQVHLSFERRVSKDINDESFSMQSPPVSPLASPIASPIHFFPPESSSKTQAPPPPPPEPAPPASFDTTEDGMDDTKSSIPMDDDGDYDIDENVRDHGISQDDDDNEEEQQEEKPEVEDVEVEVHAPTRPIKSSDSSRHQQMTHTSHGNQSDNRSYKSQPVSAVAPPSSTMPSASMRSLPTPTLTAPVPLRSSPTGHPHPVVSTTRAADQPSIETVHGRGRGRPTDRGRGGGRSAHELPATSSSPPLPPPLPLPPRPVTPPQWRDDGRGRKSRGETVDTDARHTSAGVRSRSPSPHAGTRSHNQTHGGDSSSQDRRGAAASSTRGVLSESRRAAPAVESDDGVRKQRDEDGLLISQLTEELEKSLKDVDELQSRNEHLQLENVRLAQRVRDLEALNAHQRVVIHQSASDLAECKRSSALEKDAIREECEEMKNRSIALMSLIKDNVMSFSFPPTPTDPSGAPVNPQQRMAQLDIVSQVRLMSERLVDAQSQIAAATRRKRELAHLVATLRASGAAQRSKGFLAGPASTSSTLNQSEAFHVVKQRCDVQAREIEVSRSTEKSLTTILERLRAIGQDATSLDRRGNGIDLGDGVGDGDGDGDGGDRLREGGEEDGRQGGVEQQWDDNRAEGQGSWGEDGYHNEDQEEEGQWDDEEEIY